MRCTVVRASPITSPATAALLTRRVTVRITNTNKKVRMTSAMKAAPAFAPIIDEAPKPLAPRPTLRHLVKVVWADTRPGPGASWDQVGQARRAVAG
jgi:hypothetical protein